MIRRRRRGDLLVGLWSCETLSHFISYTFGCCEWLLILGLRIALAVWFFFELIMFGAEIELQKKRKLAEAEGGAEQTEQLQLPDEEAANAKSYADVETAYQPRSTLPYEPTPAANLAGGRKEGVNVRVNEVR